MKLPIIKTPCNNCPFRKDVEPFLSGQRAAEIADAESFVCHKTIHKELKQCGGFMLISGDDSEAVRLAKALRIDLELKGRELVFDNKQDFINHHKNKGR